jgi:threonine dehydrogenase-like Zn-dependent dehydrogenase
MRAAYLVGQGVVEWGEAPEPEPNGPNQVLVRTDVATVCGSDLHNIFAGTNADPYPCRAGFPGHESVGTVVASTSPDFSVGDAVLSVPDLSCAAAFADLQLVPDHFVVPLPRSDGLTNMVLAQQLGTAIHAMERFWPNERDTQGKVATVIGAGAAGLLFVVLLRRAGFDQIVVSDPHRSRLERATALGATHAVAAQGDAVVEATMEVTAGAGADLVVEAAGEDETRTQAVEAVRLDGRLGMFGTPSSLGLVPFPFSTLFRKKPTVESSHSAQNVTGLPAFREAVRLLATGELVLDGLITHQLDADQLIDALDLALHPRDGSLKVALLFDGAGER